MDGKMPIRIDKQVSCEGGTYDYVESDIVPPGELYCIQGYGYENETGARGTFRRGVKRNSQYMWFAEYASPAAGELVFDNQEIWLTPGEQLAVRQASCTAADTLHLYAHGYKVLSKVIPGSH